MMKILVALAGVACLGVQPALAAPPAKATSSAKAKAAKAAKIKPKPVAAPPKSDAAEPEIHEPTPAAIRVIDWVAVDRDNHGLPYVVVDKLGAHAFLFDGKGKYVADTPVLIGIAPGDDASPGVGSKKLAELGPAEKSTPAGRFLAKFGRAAGNERVLWVDYTTSVAMHTIPADTKKEHRVERMLSPEIDDNRITFGCINVLRAFYAKVRPMFLKKGGYVYVMPDTKTLEEVFPPIRVQPFLSDGGSWYRGRELDRKARD